jgi:glutathione peroxidase
MRYDISLSTLDGKPTSLADYRGSVLLIVNVASRCGATPQYAGLQKLHEKYASRGLSVLGFPCNQFGEQEPGTAEQIRDFCSTNYSVSFPMFEKIEVNGAGRHPLYADLTQTPDAQGEAGDVRWNFEKFLVLRDGTTKRFRTRVEPDDPGLVAAIEAALGDPATVSGSKP